MANTDNIDSKISSAEMTAYWRSKHTQLSGDCLSVKLASQDGIYKAHSFEKKFDYPLVSRKVSVRAGFFLKQTVDLLLTKKFDSCISFASGFSLLNYYISFAIKDILPKTFFYDTDLPNIVNERIFRMSNIENKLNKGALSKLKIMVLDLEKAARQKQSLKTLFPNVCNPIFIVEGVIYFLSEKCVFWLLSEIAQYQRAAVILDYWPKDGAEESMCFHRVLQSLEGFVPENIKSFWSEKYFNTLGFDCIRDTHIQGLEHQYSRFCDEEPQFLDQNSFFPVHLLVAQRRKGG